MAVQGTTREGRWKERLEERMQKMGKNKEEVGVIEKEKERERCERG